jgi:hypothetical protein
MRIVPPPRATYSDSQMSQPSKRHTLESKSIKWLASSLRRFIHFSQMKTSLVTENDSLCSTIVGAGKCSKSFLSSCRKNSALLGFAHYVIRSTVCTNKVTIPVSQIVIFTLFAIPSEPVASSTLTLKSTPASLIKLM